MGSLVLVDSSYFITRLGQHLDPLALIQGFKLDYDFAINGVIWAEVLRGRSLPQVRDRFDAFFCTMRFLTLTPSGHRRAARLAWDLDRQGKVLPLPDLLIASTALEHGATVLTFDRHFSHIPGLHAVSDLE
jgi:predicted nucleic acid-binding protein